MTLQQLEYVVALDDTRQFVKAAEQCNVTQPTLSAMVRKLEEELGCELFDRSAHPVTPTPCGEMVIRHARLILFHARQLTDQIRVRKSDASGPLSLALIPTVAPYLLPGLLAIFRHYHPDISLKIAEMRTESIVHKLRTAAIDMAILATPLQEPGLLEVPLYYEKFIAYISPGDPLYRQKELSANGLPSENLWVLEEGHCMRNQVLNVCEQQLHSAIYEAGSIETLVKIVDKNGGYTIIPELHTSLISDTQRNNLRPIVRPEATREISLVVRQDYIRQGMMNAVAEAVKKLIPDHMIDSRLKKFAIRL